MVTIIPISVTVGVTGMVAERTKIKGFSGQKLDFGYSE